MDAVEDVAKSDMDHELALSRGLSALRGVSDLLYRRPGETLEDCEAENLQGLIDLIAGALDEAHRGVVQMLYRRRSGATSEQEGHRKVHPLPSLDELLRNNG